MITCGPLRSAAAGRAAAAPAPLSTGSTSQGATNTRQRCLPLKSLETLRNTFSIKRLIQKIYYNSFQIHFAKYFIALQAHIHVRSRKYLYGTEIEMISSFGSKSQGVGRYRPLTLRLMVCIICKAAWQVFRDDTNIVCTENVVNLADSYIF